jgi:hypothetical protein
LAGIPRTIPWLSDFNRSREMEVYDEAFVAAENARSKKEHEKK